MTMPQCEAEGLEYDQSKSAHLCPCTDADCCKRSESSCNLRGGELVPEGWKGSDTADNSCNDCSCRGGELGCTERACRVEILQRHNLKEEGPRWDDIAAVIAIALIVCFCMAGPVTSSCKRVCAKRSVSEDSDADDVVDAAPATDRLEQMRPTVEDDRGRGPPRF